MQITLTRLLTLKQFLLNHLRRMTKEAEEMVSLLPHPLPPLLIHSCSTFFVLCIEAERDSLLRTFSVRICLAGCPAGEDRRSLGTGDRNPEGKGLNTLGTKDSAPTTTHE